MDHYTPYKPMVDEIYKVRKMNEGFHAPGYGINLDPYNLDRNVVLVPDRWSHTGWKCTLRDPSDKTYFNSPNNVNRGTRPKKSF